MCLLTQAFIESLIKNLDAKFNRLFENFYLSQLSAAFDKTDLYLDDFI